MDLSEGGNEERVLLQLTGGFTDIICQVTLEHLTNVVFEIGKKLLYMTVLKEIYRCVELALRWYELFSQT